MDEILVRANFGGKTRFISLDESELDAEIFVKKGMVIFFSCIIPDQISVFSDNE